MDDLCQCIGGTTKRYLNDLCKWEVQEKYIWMICVNGKEVKGKDTRMTCVNGGTKERYLETFKA